jgi:hypothetical protein
MNKNRRPRRQNVCATSQYKINPEFGPLYVILARPRVAPRVVLDMTRGTIMYTVQLHRAENVPGVPRKKRS